MAKIRTDGIYDVPAGVLWRHVVRYDALEAVMSGLLVRVACPPGEEQPGHDITLVFKLLGIFPIGTWRLKVVGRDDTSRRLRSEESGTGVRRWAHEIAVDDAGNGRSRLSDTIEIEAGILTPLVAWFAAREYTRRHELRKQMVNAIAARGSAGEQADRARMQGFDSD